MGKNSLIKSTSKKTAEKEPEDKKKKAAAKAKKTAKAAAPKAKKAAKKAPAKSKAASTAKTAAKKSTKAKTAAKKAPKAKAAAKKQAAPKKKAPAKKKLSGKDLLFQKFDTWKPKSLYTPPADRGGTRDFTAPPVISAETAEETARLKKLLSLRFSPEALDAAAKEAAADRSKAEKAAAEKAAAEKAAAEKKAAEKAEAEKAAAEKATAEKKAADEKAAAEKAAAEKAAAEKKAAEKAEAEVSVSYTPPPEKAPADPMEKAFKYGVVGFAALLLILIGYSFANTGHYYLDSANGGLKIYQGRFAPMGKELIMTLPGVKLVEPAEEVYTRTQVYPLIYNYYVDKADALLATPGLPDYEGIRRYLNEALKYATSNDLRSAIYARLDGIELMTLLYKADVASRKENIDSLEEALDYLNEASRLEIDTSQAELIDQKREAVRAKIEQLRAEAAPAGAESSVPAPKE